MPEVVREKQVRKFVKLWMFQLFLYLYVWQHFGFHLLRNEKVTDKNNMQTLPVCN